MSSYLVIAAPTSILTTTPCFDSKNKFRFLDSLLNFSVKGNEKNNKK